jgi:Mg2+-importing ATPase
VGTTKEGLSGSEAAERLRSEGPNRVEVARRRRGLRLLVAQFANPIILILVLATVLAMLLGDLTDGTIILVIIAASGGLGFWQERRAGQVVDDLMARVRVDTEVVRDGRQRPVPVDEVVRGDVVALRAGHIVPADCRLLRSRSLLVDEAALTGESFPVEKAPGQVEGAAALAQRSNALFMGTHVVSGQGRAVVVQTGRATEFASVYLRLASADVTTSFEQGMTRFGLLLVRAMTVLVTVILVVNLVLHRPFIDSVLFSLALAVGLTPQLLPAIVAVSLAAGARRMAAEKVVVKRLDAIEDFGGMTVLCTDKTGTLTAGAIRLDRAVDLDGQPSAEVARLAWLNAGLQQGFSNPMDEAIIQALPERPAQVSRVDEVPYDFTRKRLSVLVDDHDQRLLVTKGAMSSVLQVCTQARADGQVKPLAEVEGQVGRLFQELSGTGLRVLALAVRPLPGVDQISASDEAEMTLHGLLVFQDPVKPGAAEAIADLHRLGISVRLVTGDNSLAAGTIAARVGLTGEVVGGPQIDRLDDAALAERVRSTAVFAEVEPQHKERIVKALRAGGEVVGFLGDGINDTPALHAADIGISVDTAVDVAKQTASIVLLDKGLHVIADGVRLGRQTFANTLKYVRVTISANFGNMVSMAAASAFLPFLPLLPRQILLLNLLTDIPGTTIATDAVDPEQLTSPRRWDLAGIRDFMITFGLISSVFDLATFAILRVGFHASAEMFRTGWFIESTATELAVMLILRTARPFYRSRPSRALIWSSAGIAATTLALPYLPVLAVPLGLTPLPGTILITLAGLTAVYVAANEVAKRVRLVPEPVTAANSPDP